MMTASNWTKKVTAKTGRSDCEEQDDKCGLCGTKETSDHVWRCCKLKGKRRELDFELAEADPNDFTPAMRQGVACAMNADPTRTYWGKECNEEWDEKRKRTYGCAAPGSLGIEVGKLVRNLRGG